MYEIGVEKINHWTYTCSIKLYKNKPSKVFPITKEEYEAFEIWKFNETKVSNILKRKQINADRNNLPPYTYDIAKCDCGYAWVEKVNHIPKNREYSIICPKCGVVTKKFKQ